MNESHLAEPQFHADTAASPLQAAQIFAQLERWQEALVALAPALAEGSEPEAFRLASTAHRTLENPTTARHLIEQGLARWPQDDTLHAELALVLLALSLDEAALNAARRAITIDPEWHGHHYLVALLLRKQGWLTEAESAIREALRLEPTHANSLWLLAAVLYKLDKNDQARFIIKQGLELDPNHADLLMLDGLLQGKRSARISRFRAALRLDPTDTWNQNLLHQLDRGWRRDVALAIGICLLQLVLHEWPGLAPAWLPTALLLIPGIWLVQPGRIKVLWVFASVSILILGTRISFIELATSLPEALSWAGLFKLFGHLVASFAMGGVAILVLWVLRAMSMNALHLAWKFLVELYEARRNRVLPDKLREIARSKGTHYNLIACALPVGLPLFGHSTGLVLTGLFLAQPAVLWLAGRVLLPAEKRTPVFLLYFALSFPLGMIVGLNLMGENWAWPNRFYAALGMGVYTLLVANSLRKL